MEQTYPRALSPPSNVNHLVPEPSERLATEGETSDMKSQIAQQHPSGGRQMQAAAIRMTPHQIALVRESFATVVPISEQAVGLFYDRLFAIDPSTRPLFQGDMKSQGAKLMAAIGAVVKSLDCIETILGDLRALLGVMTAMASRRSTMPASAPLCSGR
jgi:hypothetical protein